jgi:hypothetical protein
MSRKRAKTRERKTNPTYFVFCEGKTEEAYAKFLRQKYRLPIEIKAKVTGQEISDAYIRAYLKGKVVTDFDKNYLMYDLDAVEFIPRLKAVRTGIVLGSNPSIELWFLLHYRNQRAYISTANCNRDLKGLNREYEKGCINSELKKNLDSNILQAVDKAKTFRDYANPSSMVYKLVEELERVNEEKKRFS